MISFVFVFEPHLVECRAYYWLCTRASLLEGLGDIWREMNTGQSRTRQESSPLCSSPTLALFGNNSHRDISGENQQSPSWLLHQQLRCLSFLLFWAFECFQLLRAMNSCIRNMSLQSAFLSGKLFL